MKLTTGSGAFTDSGATKVVASKAGRLWALLATASTLGKVTLYDNTAGSGTKLLVVSVEVGVPVVMRWPYGAAFTTGLTVVCDTGVYCHVSVESG